jgi:hypothetical protein
MELKRINFFTFCCRSAFIALACVRLGHCVALSAVSCFRIRLAERHGENPGHGWD